MRQPARPGSWVSEPPGAPAARAAAGAISRPTARTGTNAPRRKPRVSYTPSRAATTRSVGAGWTAQSDGSCPTSPHPQRPADRRGRAARVGRRHAALHPAPAQPALDRQLTAGRAPLGGAVDAPAKRVAVRVVGPGPGLAGQRGTRAAHAGALDV